MRRLLILSCTIVLVDTLFFAALAPLVPYYAQELGLSAVAVGILNGAYGVGIVAGAAPGAYLAIRFGVRPAAITGLTLLALTSFLFGFADDAVTLTALRFGGGFGSAASWTATFTWIVAVAPKARRGQMIGIVISAAVVGALLGPILGSAAAVFGIVPAFTVVALLSIMTAIAVLREPPPGLSEQNPRGALRELIHLKPAAGLCLIAFSPLLFSTLIVLAPLELASLGWNASRIGIVFLVGAAFEAVAHPIAGRWSDRSGYRIPITASLALSAVVLLALPLADQPWRLGALVAVSAAIFNLPLTPGTVLFTESVERVGGGQALAFAMTNVAWAAGFAIGAPLGGFLSSLGGETLTYFTLAACCAAFLIMIRRLIASESQQEQEGHAK